MRLTRVLLIIIAVVCIGVAVSYPIRYRLARDENNSNMEDLAAMRARAMRQTETDEANTAEPGVPDNEDAVGAEEEPAPGVPVRPTIPPGEQGWDEPADEAGNPANGQTDGQANGQAGGQTNTQTGGQPQSATDGQSQPTSGEADARPEGGAPNATGEDAPMTAGGGDVPDGGAVEQPVPEAPVETATPEPTPAPTPTPEPTPIADPDLELLFLDYTPTPAPTISVTPKVVNGSIVMAETPEPEPTPVWDEYTGPLPYPMLDKVELDENAILPELREIRALNHDLVGWINIPDTVIDYPVVQCEDSDYYLEHDFYGQENINGQIILDTLCDPYTPSYNLIISGHHMKNGSMFGNLPEYQKVSYWQKHMLIEFDSLMFRKRYVVFAAFYSADYDEDEEGFRYNANIQYKMEAKQWLKEIEENRLYDTGIDVQFGDEFITLTTCNRARHKNGRFVVVARKIREGETFE